MASAMASLGIWPECAVKVKVIGDCGSLRNDGSSSSKPRGEGNLHRGFA